MKRLLLAPKGIREFSPEEYREYVRGFYIKPETRGSQLVDGVGITFGDRVIVRVKRAPKYVTEEEVRLLSEEYGKSVEELTKLFRSRKIEIK